MAGSWQKRRSPEEVPTPVAVALADYCRRARVPSPPADVREALCALDPSEDFRVEALAAGEPDRRLGPYAAVDLLRGTPPQVAEAREACGYYALVQELLRADEVLPSPPPEPLPAPPARFRRGGEPAPSAGPAARQTPQAPQAAQTPGPERPAASGLWVRRGAAPAGPPPAPSPGSGPPRPEPRGRFTQLPSSKQEAGQLFTPQAREELERQLQQHPHRLSLLRALEHEYAGTGGQRLSETEMELALQRHGLWERLTGIEKERLLAAYNEQRGASGRVAWSLGLSPSELRRLVASLGIEGAVALVRERFIARALTLEVLADRLDLLDRRKYLADLGIQQRFAQALAADVERLLEDALPEGGTLAARVQAVAQAQRLSPERILRAVRSLGLARRFEAVGPEPTPSLR